MFLNELTGNKDASVLDIAKGDGDVVAEGVMQRPDNLSVTEEVPVKPVESLFKLSQAAGSEKIVFYLAASLIFIYLSLQSVNF